jgi:Mn-dependent DtxR family transcriptional regulator
LRPGERLVAVGVVHALAMDAAAVHAETSPYEMPVSPDSIVRIDRRTGGVTTSAPVLGYPGPLAVRGQ